MFANPRRLIIAASFASCCFLNSWVTIALGQSFYFLYLDPWRGIAVPVLLAQAAVAAAVLAAWPVLQKAPLRHWWILLGCSVPLVYAIRAIAQAAPFDLYAFRFSVFFWPVALSSAAAAGYAVIRRPERVASLLLQVLHGAWPLLLLVYANAAWQMFFRTSPADFQSPPVSESRAKAPASRRVLWLVFDEFSRPAAEQSPVFRDFAARGFSARHAQHAGPYTELALPSLIEGKVYTRTDRKGPRTMVLDGKTRFGEVENVFDSARKMGAGTALAGWYHPYCRVLQRSLDECVWVPGWQQAGSEEMIGGEPPVLPRLLMQARAFPVIGKRLPVADYHRTHKIDTLDTLMQRGRKMAADPNLGLVLLHLPVPHPPHVVDRKTRRLGEGRYAYRDSVAHAEMILQDLLGAVDAAGLAGNTTVIVSSDHGYRIYYWNAFPDFTAEDAELGRDPGIAEIPFIVKLPGGAEAGPAATFDKPFNAVVTRQLIERILNGSLRTHADIAAQLAAAAPSH